MKKPSVLSLPTLLVFSAFLFATQLASAAPDTWTGATDSNWGSAGNWDNANPPNPGDSLFFGSSGGGTLVNNLTDGTAFYGLTFNGSAAFTLNGPSSVLISGQGFANTIGIVNNSGQAQMIGTMPLNLDWGYYTFSSPSGTLALDSTITPNAGGVAFFGANLTSALSLDSAGLISGLGGAGLMYSGSTPTGLATISGGNIVAYPNGSYVSYATPAGINNGVNDNVLLTATGSGAYTASGISVNTITSASVGNAGGTATTVLTTTGTLTLGANGGVYLLGNTLGNKTCLSLTGGAITAGSSGPATIVFAVNGNTSGNQLSVSSAIQDNAGAGAVTVVVTGPGSMNFSTTTATSYSGGTYINQGQLQWGQVTGVGTGPIYVSPTATAYYTGTTLFPNDFYLSPGLGAGSAAAYANGGALIAPGSSAAVTLSGTIHLLGAPVTAPPGCRISTEATSKDFIFGGQITGTGTLETYQGAHSGNVVLSNVTANANNWTGGLLIWPRAALSCYFKMGADNQMPNGPGTGDITMLNQGATDVRFDLNGHNATINALNASGSGTVAKQELANIGTANSTVTMGANNDDGLFYGVTLDAAARTLSLVKIGSGTQTFNGNAAFGYLGNTTVSNGTFALAGYGQIPSSPVITIASGATLDVSTLIGGLNLGAAQTLNCVGTILGDTIINGTVQALDPIGTLTETGNMTLSGSPTYVWHMNDATGTAGADPGWSLLNVSGALDLSSLGAGSFTINVTSLNGSDVAGSAAHFSSGSSYGWTIAQAAGGITGFSSGQFNIVTANFANFPGSPSQWSVTQSGNNLVLNFTPSQVIITPITSTETVNQGHDAAFTVTANPAGTGTTFAWTQNGNPLTDGGTSAGGSSGNVTIATVGNTSTLTIHGVDNVGPALDGGTISVTVTTTLDSTLQSANSIGTLTVIDIPYNPSVAQSQSVTPATAGAVNILAASASGTQPFTYQWYLDGNAIGGATGSNLVVNVSPDTVGSYMVMISNPAGSVTSGATVIAPVGVVPNQIVYEPFNYITQDTTQSAGNPWTAFGVTNIYNQATGAGLMWVNTGALGQEWTRPQDMRIEPGFDNTTYTPNGDSYPWPGLAGNDPQEMACNSANTGVGLPLGTGGSISSGTVYFSVVCHIDQGSSITQSGNDYFCGFGTGTPSSPAYTAGIFVHLPSDDTVTPGVFKIGTGGTAAINPGVNGDWCAAGPTTSLHRGQIVFLVCRLNINPGAANDTCDLWVNPSPFTFSASEANVPAANVANAGGGAPDVGNVDFFWIKNTQAPSSRRFTDLRIGTTWASVTPPAPPALSLASIVLAPGVTTAAFASQNAGNPVDPGVGPYQWQFNGGSPLFDGPTGHGSTISGSSSATLTITGITPSDLGTYTVTGSNADPLNSYYDPSATPPVSGDRVFNPTGTNFVSSVSATLSSTPPQLHIVYSAPNFIIYWPWTAGGYTLQQSPTVAPTTWTTCPGTVIPISEGGYTIDTVTVTPSGPEYFRLIR